MKARISSEAEMLQLYAKSLGLTPEEVINLGSGDSSALVLKLLSDRLSGSGSLSLALAILLLGRRNPVVSPHETESDNQSPFADASASKVDPTPEASMILSRVALMLGACPDCCGLSERCWRCQGDSGPGREAPSGDLVSWIQPALQRLGMRVVPEEVNPTV